MLSLRFTKAKTAARSSQERTDQGMAYVTRGLANAQDVNHLSVMAWLTSGARAVYTRRQAPR
jgi:hypothetical protein